MDAKLEIAHEPTMAAPPDLELKGCACRACGLLTVTWVGLATIAGTCHACGSYELSIAGDAAVLQV